LSAKSCPVIAVNNVAPGERPAAARITAVPTFGLGDTVNDFGLTSDALELRLAAADRGAS
jgi:hypothetical protein